MAELILHSEQEMKQFGAQLIQNCDSAGIITLRGDLGTGKTTLVRGALEHCGVTSGVRSPTYTLIEYYELEPLSVAHFDLYRLGDPEELEYLGFRDYLNSKTLCFIEWPEKASFYLDGKGLEVVIGYQPEGRKLALEAQSPWGQSLVNKLNFI